MTLLLILLACFLLPHCSMQTRKAYQQLERQSISRTGAATEWKRRVETLFDPPIIEQGLSVEHSIQFALKHNTTLQASLEELGISAAELLQAGLYSNPVLFFEYELPLDRKRSEKAEISIDSFWRISDLWQIPFRKKIAQDDLEIKIIELTHLILHIVRQTKEAYFDCLYHLERYKRMQLLYDTVQEWQERLVYRKQFGFSTDYDIYFAQVRVAEWNVMLIEAEKSITGAFIALRDAMGLPITLDPINLTTDFYMVPPIPTKNTMVNVAKKNQPELIIQQLRMQKAKHDLSYQKSKIFDEVMLGVVFERDAEGDKTLGPGLELRVPVLNWNTGNIKRAQYRYREAEKRRFSKEQDIERDLLRLSVHYESTLKQIAVIKSKMIPNAAAGTDYANHYYHTMQMDSIVLLDSEIALHKTHLNYLDVLLNAYQTYAELEFVVGQQLSSLPVSTG